MTDEQFAEFLLARIDEEPANEDEREALTRRLIEHPEDLDAFVEAQRFEQELRAATLRREEQILALDAIHEELAKADSDSEPDDKPTPLRTAPASKPAAWILPAAAAALVAFVIGVAGSWFVFGRTSGDRAAPLFASDPPALRVEDAAGTDAWIWAYAESPAYGFNVDGGMPAPTTIELAKADPVPARYEYETPDAAITRHDADPSAHWSFQSGPRLAEAELKKVESDDPVDFSDATDAFAEIPMEDAPREQFFDGYAGTNEGLWPKWRSTGVDFKSSNNDLDFEPAEHGGEEWTEGKAGDVTVAATNGAVIEQQLTREGDLAIAAGSDVTISVDESRRDFALLGHGGYATDDFSGEITVDGQNLHGNALKGDGDVAAKGNLSLATGFGADAQSRVPNGQDLALNGTDDSGAITTGGVALNFTGSGSGPAIAQIGNGENGASGVVQGRPSVQLYGETAGDANRPNHRFVDVQKAGATVTWDDDDTAFGGSIATTPEKDAPPSEGPDVITVQPASEVAIPGPDEAKPGAPDTYFLSTFGRPSREDGDQSENGKRNTDLGSLALQGGARIEANGDIGGGFQNGGKQGAAAGGNSESILDADPQGIVVLTDGVNATTNFDVDLDGEGQTTDRETYRNGPAAAGEAMASGTVTRGFVEISGRQAAEKNGQSDLAEIEERGEEFEQSVDSTILLAREKAEEGRYKEALDLVEKNLPPGSEATKHFVDDLADPEIYNPALTPEHVARVKRLDQANKIAESYVRLGDYEQAEASFREALDEDPYNAAARRGGEENSSQDQKKSAMPGADESWGIETQDENANGRGNDWYAFDWLQTEADLGRPEALFDQPVEAEWQRYPGHPAATGFKPIEFDEILASDEPFSTFSLNVSDVSFGLAQASLASGQWPDSARIRIEEFVNAFDYGDPTPGAHDKIACVHEQAAHPFYAGRNLMRISMRTAEAGRSSQTPLRLTLLLDTSGSMERADRRETTQRALDLLAQQLLPTDQVTVIAFARQPRLLADSVSGGEAAKSLANVLVRNESDGGTNLEAALRLAKQKAEEQKIEGAQNRIVLITDGAANLGDADPDRLAGLVESMRLNGLAFDAAGVGAEGYNDETLEALTRKGDGRYYFLDRPEDADEGFAKQIAGALRPAAMNVKVQVEFNPKRVGNYKLLGFEKHRLEKEDFRNDAVDAAELAAAEAGVALYQIEPLAEGEGDIGFVSVRFRDMSSGQMVERRWPIPYDPTVDPIDQASANIRLATAAAMLGAKLKRDEIGEAVDLQQIEQIVRELPQNKLDDPRVQQLLAMIAQTQGLSGE